MLFSKQEILVRESISDDHFHKGVRRSHSELSRGSPVQLWGGDSAALRIQKFLMSSEKGLSARGLSRLSWRDLIRRFFSLVYSCTS